MHGGAKKNMPPGLPGCLKKRRLLNDKELRPEVCREFGEKFLAQAWWDDAMEFFRKGDCQEGLEKIKAYCLESGDAYLLARLGKQEPELWREMADRALRSGKRFFAWRALKQAGRHEEAEILAHELREEGWLSSP